MMPKGVEHKIARASVRSYHIVKIPMMPKGVEHQAIAKLKIHIGREDSNDAERR